MAVDERAEVGVIPDEIEPRTGFKYLRVYDNGRMSSPWAAMDWPPLERAVATPEGCEEWSWHPLRHPPEGLYYGPGDVGSGVTAPPMVELPEGLEWYLVQVHHEAPGERCSCGIYAVDEPADCRHYRSVDCVLVELAMWGRVIPGSAGTRSQFAYPKAIYAERGNLKLAQAAATLYQVPLVAAEETEKVVVPIGRTRSQTDAVMGGLIGAISIAMLAVQVTFLIMHPDLLHLFTSILIALTVAFTFFNLSKVWRG